jgi:DNA/RNA-binding domain of Phe-tRNA-synthetase-like protein
LLRRVRKGDTIPRINSAVDIVNWCSLEFQLPYGLYDFSKVSGPVTMRRGAEGEKYAGIRKDDVNVAGRITVADRAGAFGNPTRIPRGTMVTPATTELLIVSMRRSRSSRRNSAACWTRRPSASLRSLVGRSAGRRSSAAG